MSRLTLALDAMGGDIGPRITVPASIKALEQDPVLSLLLFGDSQQISPLLNNIPAELKQRITSAHEGLRIGIGARRRRALRPLEAPCGPPRIYKAAERPDPRFPPFIS